MVPKILSSMHFNVPEVARRQVGHTLPSLRKSIQHTTTPASQNHDTPYTVMLKEEAQMDWRYNLLVSIANWALLAGYLVVPGTFTSLKESNQVEEVLKKNTAGQAVLHTIQNPPLLVIACLFLLGGAATLIMLFRELQSSYTWLVNKIFMPAALNAAAGLITTLVNVYTSRSGHWSVMAIVTIVVTGALLIVFSLLFTYYKFVKLRRVILDDEERFENQNHGMAHSTGQFSASDVSLHVTGDANSKAEDKNNTF
ncbi:unnamed protein product [Penicillium olsonii]|nr:unnamed protein product [Penicillium olsonii]